ncbi:MAG: hypothetical protein EU536_03485 [Promethearchaeota archaeon]|nr:MAG: hypothetical protein EU536_03485 [Candidatus Lokiarchaeota archaeon]
MKVGQFNSYLLAFICCLLLGLVFLIIGFIILNAGAIISGYSMIGVSIGVLALAAIFLIAGLVKYGRQSRYPY